MHRSHRFHSQQSFSAQKRKPSRANWTRHMYSIHRLISCLTLSGISFVCLFQFKINSIPNCFANRLVRAKGENILLNRIFGKTIPLTSFGYEINFLIDNINLIHIFSLVRTMKVSVRKMNRHGMNFLASINIF